MTEQEERKQAILMWKDTKLIIYVSLIVIIYVIFFL